MKSMERIWTVSVAAALLALGAGIARAATVTAVSSGEWTNTATWSGGAVPGVADTVNIRTNFTVTVDSSISTNIGYLVNVGTYGVSAGFLTINGGLLAFTNTIAGGVLYMDGGSGLVITNGGRLKASRANQTFVQIGSVANSSNNYLLVSDAGSVVTFASNGGLSVGLGSNSWGNSAVFSNGAANSGSSLGVPLTVGGGTNSYNNRLVFDNASNSIPVNSGSTVSSGSGVGAHDNTVVITNGAYGGQVALRVGSGASSYNNGLMVAGTNALSQKAAVNFAGTSGISLNLVVGGGTNAYNNYVWIGAGGQVVGTGGAANNGDLNIGAGPGAYGNYLVVTNGGSVAMNGLNVANISYLRVGAATGAGLTNNYLVVDGADSSVSVQSNSRVMVGTTNNAADNYILLRNGGLLEGVSFSVGYDATSTGNGITNRGGIIQFTSATPTIAVSNAPNNGIVITNGTLSFRNVAVVNLTNNWSGGLLSPEYGVTWQGNNTLRLDNSTGTNTLGRSYRFDTGYGETNYVNLELLGTSLIRGGGVTIGAAGNMLVSNGTVNITGALTNNGTITLAGSPASLMATNGFYNNGLLTGSGVISGLVTVSASGTLSAGGAGATGTLTFSTNVVFNGGTNIMNFTSSTNDQILVLGTISGTNYLQIVPSPPGAAMSANVVLFTFAQKDSATYIKSLTDGYAVQVTTSNVILRASSRGTMIIMQ